MSVHWSPSLGAHVHILRPSNFYIVKECEVISTILGSCVAVCLRDTQKKIGGMNHFLLPYKSDDRLMHWPNDYQTEQLRYGDISMELLINELVAKGAQRNFLEAKIFGGASMIESSISVGECNITFAREYLATEEIPIVAEDIGGFNARKIIYNVKSGNVDRYLISTTEQKDVTSEENAYYQRIINHPVNSKIDYLDDN